MNSPAQSRPRHGLAALWQGLAPAEQAKLLGLMMLGGGLFTLAASLAYFAYQIQSLQTQLPRILEQTEITLQKTEPILREVEAVRSITPAILKEVAATRTLVPGVVAEVKAIREQVPAILTEVGKTREALPGLLANTAGTVGKMQSTVKMIEPHISPVLDEVKQTREALPGLLDRADRTIDKAGKIGKEAGAGAAYGMIGGIVTAPFRLIGDIGMGAAGLVGLTNSSEFTAEDEKIASQATQAVLEAGKTGAERAWENPESHNRGDVRLLNQSQRGGQPCAVLRYRFEFASGAKHETETGFCRQENGGWSKVGSTGEADRK